ncbi:MAG: hypothetical protein A3F54_04905 [Candidatus Kerfeldbacteria bacterium RIFCSPHIGHO2_12_FULL_48_17]|uniref:Methyltransferase type 11 domain-containing protein n=1 Tax=Candidatus Kerfeldbacteria bacterium RIFCSPHIGHO2_12_FULL_48_17 TaxID=1798542 RepID=A0A1G2B3F2_9BACT|nr:MAG: hypothetical protein A3F54_04905 [Candidatus Kerfeldbacteria bacterium RIFCSPHIGHO2_12_FULL_48_17]
MNDSFSQQQFNLEKKWHQALLAETDASKRRSLYQQAYGEFFAFAQKHNIPQDYSSGRLKNVAPLYRFCIQGKTGVDFGCGEGRSTLAWAQFARQMYGIEVEETAIAAEVRQQAPAHVAYMISQGNIPLPAASVDFVFSQEVFEHLHPQDGVNHLREVYALLKPEGRYIMMMPNRLFGPNDISGQFLARGSQAQGLHLREYSYAEITDLARQAGFRRVTSPLISEYVWRVLGLSFLYKYFFVPVQVKIRLERWLDRHYFGALTRIIGKILRVTGITVILEK